MNLADATAIETTPIPLPWPPRCFDFEEPILRANNVHFERNADAEPALIRRVGRVRIVVDLNRIHTFAPIVRGSRDFHLLNLVPEALRFVEQVAPFDPLPAELLPDEPMLPPEPYLRAATARLLRVIAAQVEKDGRVIGDPSSLLRDHSQIFQRAAGQSLMHAEAAGRFDPLAHRLQQLANAHAGVLAAQAAMPDFAAMAQRVAQLRRRLGGNHHCPDVLLNQALSAVLAQIERPGQTVDRLFSQAEAELWRPQALRDIPGQIRRQRGFEARLREIALFWRRTCREWLSQRVERPNWRHIEVLARSTQRRLAADVYDDDEERYEG